MIVVLRPNQILRNLVTIKYRSRSWIGLGIFKSTQFNLDSKKTGKICSKYFRFDFNKVLETQNFGQVLFKVFLFRSVIFEHCIRLVPYKRLRNLLVDIEFLDEFIFWSPNRSVRHHINFRRTISNSFWREGWWYFAWRSIRSRSVPRINWVIQEERN